MAAAAPASVPFVVPPPCRPPLPVARPQSLLEYRSYVGRRVRLDAEYFADVEDVDTPPADWSFGTAELLYRARDQRWVFLDHEGSINHVGWRLLRRLLQAHQDAA